MAYLFVENIRKSFQGNIVLRDISFTLEKGEVLSLIGPSGGGKTTLLRCLNGLETPDAGKISLDGQILFPKSDNIIDHSKTFGMVFQMFHLFPQYTVRENIMLAPKLRKLGSEDTIYEKANLLLEKVALLDKADSYPGTLSGGQQQRCAIARALALDPDILCFDEPTSALDPLLTKEVLSVIRDLRSEGRTMIIVTHEMRFARDVSDSILFLSNGQIQEQGKAEQVFTSPQTDALKVFLSRELQI